MPSLGNGYGIMPMIGYTLSLHATSLSPADATTYYWGGLAAVPQTAAGRTRIYIPVPGQIKRAEIFLWASGVAGSAEAWSMYIQKNGAGDTLIATVSVADALRRWSNHALAIPVAVDDYVEIKTICPTWATNPTTVYWSGRLYVG